MKIPLAVLAVAAALPALAQIPAAAPPPAKAEVTAQAYSDLAAEVQKAVTAYNAQDLKYYEAILDTQVTYIADDGAVFSGKDRVAGLFQRLFARPTPPRIEVTDVVTSGRGDTAWATFKWSLTAGDKSRPGVSTTLFHREGGQWKLLLVQNTVAGHAMPAAGAPHKP